MEQQAPKKTPHTGKVGRIRFKVWENFDQQGKYRPSIEIFRSYGIKKEGQEKAEWKDTHKFSVEDLDLIKMVLEKVTEYLKTK
jgi:hypothetical protein